MTPGPSLLAHWYYHLPNLLLVLWTWLLIVRLVLSLAMAEGRRHGAVRLLVALTDPVLKAVGAITPRLVPRSIAMTFAIVWLLAARIALFVAVSAKGVRLSMG
jgi:hypothetical protein